MVRVAARLLEITDLLWQVDADGLPAAVDKADVLRRLTERGQRHAARIVSAFPDADGVLDPDYVDDLGFRVHCELQRLGEELQLARRITALLGPVAEAVRRRGTGPVRVIDVGCGLGFVVRAMAASLVLGDDVELVGVDLNPVLVAGARRLAEREGLACHFVQGDALRPGVAVDEGARCIVISSGFLHHLPEAGLSDFFAAQARLGVAAFAHWDIAPCLWSTLGAWVFHQARMREPVSRHDGVVSARRSYPADVLEAAARAAAPGYDVRVLEGSRWHPRALDVLRPVVGIRA
jgi:SAM-dependent methyltransferase